ncbi:hypothetical protein GCM10025859_16880 [Alicyclobacillus fastidiosus]|nr:hypothetical protein GCM10025859_16880 [Alicyclobacillus fastidiosus]
MFSTWTTARGDYARGTYCALSGPAHHTRSAAHEGFRGSDDARLSLCRAVREPSGATTESCAARETTRKKLLLHADLIQGLKHDEAAAQFLCQMVRPAGLISTHSTVIATAKKNRVLGIQRVFLIDSHSLETSYRVLASSKPDYIEVLPGVLPDVIREVKHGTKLPILAGGFIRTPEEIRSILESGATAVTTSHRDLWSFGEHLQHGN